MGEIIKDVWKRGTYHNIAFWICLGISIVLMVISFFIPPAGIIDSSVFIGTSILFAYTALASFNAALDRGVDAKLKHGDTELHIINDEDKNKELSEEYDT